MSAGPYDAAFDVALQALRIIAGKQQCIDNLMSHAEIAADALRIIEDLKTMVPQS